jgi:transposase-like protein
LFICAERNYSKPFEIKFTQTFSKELNQQIIKTEIRTAEGKLYLFVAIDRTSKLLYGELLKRAGKIEAAGLLTNLIKVCALKVDKTFTNRSCDKKAFMHIFDRICIEDAIEHRITKTEYECAIQEATVNKYFYKDYDELNEHLCACTQGIAKKV